MVYVFLAEGFEETEAVAPIDVLRRAGIEVCTVGVGGRRQITGAHGIPITADRSDDTLPDGEPEMIVLPGGMPGTRNLEASRAVLSCIDRCAEKGIWIGAICAAPSILGHKGLLKGRRVVCFPGFEPELAGAILEKGPVCEDGNIITAKGPGVAVEFGLALAAKLKGAHKAETVRSTMQCLTEGPCGA